MGSSTLDARINTHEPARSDRLGHTTENTDASVQAAKGSRRGQREHPDMREEQQSARRDTDLAGWVHLPRCLAWVQREARPVQASGDVPEC